MAAELPQDMLCVAIAESDKGGTLRACRRPLPVPGPREVLIEIAAAGVNKADVKQRRGVYPMPPGAPDVPGLEVSGVIVAAGRSVRRWRVGDAVCALVLGGGYAQYCVAPELQCLRAPAGWSLRDAASLPEAAFTVWTSLIEQARLRAGERVLVHGGAGGIGAAAVQIAKALGCEVITTAGSDQKCEFSLRLGADFAINYRTQDFVSEVVQITGGEGVNVIMDVVGAPYLERNMAALAAGGRLAFVSYEAGRDASFDIQKLMLRRLILTGSTVRHRNVREKGRIARALERSIWPYMESGRYVPVVTKVLPLAQAAKAHAHLESGNNIGKILLTP